jgi:DNA-binding transcriptional LysR family regulator
MSLRQMEYLVTVLEQGSFTRAAETLHVTQSALSHQIKALERETGGPLLERLPRGVRLTAMGRAFVPDAELAVRSARRARLAARAAAGAEGGELHVATLHGLAVALLPGAVARMRARHPGVALTVHEFATEEELRERLARGVSDLAVAYPPRTAGWDGVAQQVAEEEVRVVVPPDDPLCGKGPVRLAQLADRGWVRCAMEPLVDGVPFLEAACGREGFVPRTVVRAGHTTTSARIAANGGGVGLVPAAIAELVAPARQILRTDPVRSRPVVALSRAELTGAARAFVALLGQGRPGQCAGRSGECAA